MSAWWRRVNLPGLAVVVLILVCWEALFRLKLVSFTSIPKPTDVVKSLSTLVSSGDIAEPLGHTLWIVIAGSALALGFGLLVGTCLGLSANVHTWSMASVDFLRSVPVVALLPVAVLVWGPSTKSELIITAYAATWVMTVNTAGGFRSVHPRLEDVARTFRLSRMATVRKIWLPAIVPALLVGARLSVVTASLTAIIAETLVNPEGLGWQLIRSQQALRPGDLWAYALVAGLFGYLLNLLLITLVRLMSPGGRDNPALIGA